VSRRLRIVSVCRSLPTPDDPSGGIFVHNRLAAMAAHSELRAIQPVPYFPLLRPLPRWAAEPRRVQGALSVENAPMLYVPGVLKALDARWLARSIAPITKRLHREQPIDVLDAHFGSPDGAGCARIAERLGVPLFITVRGYEMERVHDRFVGNEMIRALRAADGCIAVSHTLAGMLERNGVEPRRIRVIHNAIDQQTFKFGDAGSARTRLGLDATRPLVVSVGHLIERKRHHVLLDAFARFRKQRPDAELAIVGGRSFEPKYPERLRSLVRELELGDSVRFVGNLRPSDVVPWLQAADLFVLLSAREGCCNAVLESLAAGAPTIVTPAGDNDRFVLPLENGDIVPLDDAAGTAAAMERAVQRRWDRPAIARRLAAQVGTWDVVARRVLDFMDERLEARAERRSAGAGVPRTALPYAADTTEV
jgi:glycosyltransferase involved in cell wall biosynthesis